MSTQITIEQFAALVREMRIAQNEYFRSGVKAKFLLEKSKCLEYRVDKLARRIPPPPEGEELKNDASTQKLFL